MCERIRNMIAVHRSISLNLIEIPYYESRMNFRLSSASRTLNTCTMTEHFWNIKLQNIAGRAVSNFQYVKLLSELLVHFHFNYTVKIQYSVIAMYMMSYEVLICQKSSTRLFCSACLSVSVCMCLSVCIEIINKCWRCDSSFWTL